MRGWIDPHSGFEAGGASRQLIVLLHAIGQKPQGLQSLKAATRKAMPDADTWVPALPIRFGLTRWRGKEMAEALVSGISTLVAERDCQEGRPYESVVLVGYSFGCALARAVWALAMGGQPDGSADLSQALPWGPKVTRMVFLAAVARGWNQMAPVETGVRLRFWGLTFVELVCGPNFAAIDLRRGAPWITLVRLQCIAINRAIEKAAASPDGIRSPVTVQLLGTKDDVVAPADMVAEDLDDQDLDWSHPGELASGAQTALLKGREEVQLVVFPIHGIRDHGHWTRRLAVEIKKAARARTPSLECRTVTSSYGFFPMGPFLFRVERRKRAGWLMDQYVTARANYPNARFSFVGHSNGTYLLANALQECPAVHFDDVVFAGSVVRQDYSWQKLMAPQCFGKRQPQVRRVLNYVATGDVVVALFPGGLEWWPRRDLGGAGHHGFKPRTQPGVTDVIRIPGGHPAALDGSVSGQITDFILGGDPPPALLKPTLTAAQARWAAIASAVGVAPGRALIGLALIVLGLLSLVVWGLSAMGFLGLLFGLPLLTLALMRVVTRL